MAASGVARFSGAWLGTAGRRAAARGEGFLSFFEGCEVWRRLGWLGWARPGEAARGEGFLILARPGVDRRRAVWSGMAMAGLGSARITLFSGLAGSGGVRYGDAWLGAAKRREARRRAARIWKFFMVGPCMAMRRRASRGAGHGEVLNFWQGPVWRGGSWCGGVGRGMARIFDFWLGGAWNGRAARGDAGHGPVWSGVAMQGEDTKKCEH